MITQPVGTLKVHDGKILFRNKFSGYVGEARGVVYRHSHAVSDSGGMETIESFTAHSIEIELYKYDEEAFCVEHIDNLSTSYLWPDMIDIEENTSSTTTIKWDEDSISIPREKQRSGGSRAAMHLKLAGYDLIICANEREENKRAGYIVYRGTPELSIRDKIRDVISFVLGRPIVCYGHTIYSHEWFPSKAASIDTYSINGMIFSLHSLPPYPIFSENTRNVLDSAVVQTICSSILAYYDQLDMQKSSWAYWHAMCAPYHMEAAHFGALVEKVQSVVAKELLPKSERNLIPAETWKRLRPAIIDLFGSLEIESENWMRLIQAVDGIGRVPQALIMARLFQRLGAPLGNVETRAWQQRNSAAHGIMRDDHIAILLNNKVLRLIFHRLVAAVTSCSSRYIDYYNFSFPIRHLRESLPDRPSQ